MQKKVLVPVLSAFALAVGGMAVIDGFTRDMVPFTARVMDIPPDAPDTTRCVYAHDFEVAIAITVPKGQAIPKRIVSRREMWQLRMKTSEGGEVSQAVYRPSHHPVESRITEILCRRR